MKNAGDPMLSMNHSFHVHGMECSSCINKVHTALLSIHGIHSVKVSLDPPAAEIVMDSHVAIETMNKALGAVGDYSLESIAPDEQPKRSSSTVLETKESFYPLFLLVGFVLGGVILREFNRGYFDSHFAMSNFLGSILATFSFFKILNLKRFVEGYQSYDLIASRSRGYAFLYPFFELSLGVLYLIDFAPKITNVLTMVLMTISGVGAFKVVSSKDSLKVCSTDNFLNLPLPKFILTEAFGMVTVAAIALLRMSL